MLSTHLRTLTQGRIAQLIPLLTLAAAASACSQASDERGATSTLASSTLTDAEAKAARGMVAFEAEDLVLNFDGATEARRSALTLADLGVSDAELGAINLATSGIGTEFSNAEPDCVARTSNWRVTGVRVVPNGIAVPGQPDAWSAWAEKKGADIERLVQLRYVVSPYCAQTRSGSSEVRAEDFALHMIYSITPSQAGAATGFTRDTITARGFTDKIIAGDDDGAARIAEAHLTALNSMTWREFRAGVLSDWNSIARTRNAAGRKRDSLASVFSRLIDWTLPDKFLLVANDVATPDLLDAKNSATAKEIARLTKTYATRANLSAATSMFTRGGLFWQFGAFSVDTAGAIVPTRMLSFNATVRADRVKVTPVMEQERQASITNAKRLPGATDAQVAQGEFSQDSRSSESAFAREAKTVLLDPRKVNATTMSCQGCHLNVASFVDGEFTDQYDFHMMSAGRLTAFTAVETRSEAARVNEEFHLAPLTPPAPPAPPAPVVTPVRTPVGPVAPPSVTPKPIVSCVVVEPGFANVRASNDASTARASLVTGTKVVLRSDLNIGSRAGIQVSGWLHFSNTSCASGSPAACANGARVKAASPVTLGRGSVSGVNLRPTHGTSNLPLGLIANGETLIVNETRADGWLKVTVAGTVLKSMCR